jgi:amidophosphoribosyltransferase
MVRAAGAKEIHMRISCPPTISPCFYGIDTPTKKELIASSHTVEEIAKYIEADSLSYLSLPGLLRAVGDDKGKEFCTACYTGQYPIDFAEMMDDAKADDRQLDLWEASLDGHYV